MEKSVNVCLTNNCTSVEFLHGGWAFADTRGFIPHRALHLVRGSQFIFENQDSLDKFLQTDNQELAGLQDYVRLCRQYTSPLVLTVDELVDLAKLYGIVKHGEAPTLHEQLKNFSVKTSGRLGMLESQFLVPTGFDTWVDVVNSPILRFHFTQQLKHLEQFVFAAHRKANTLNGTEVTADFKYLHNINREILLVPKTVRKRPSLSAHWQHYSRGTKPFKATVYPFSNPMLLVANVTNERLVVHRNVPLDISLAAHCSEPEPAVS